MTPHEVRLAFLEIEGFRGVRRPLQIEFPRSFTVVTGRNGSGKSTLCDAIEYALTRSISKYRGGTEKGESVEDYIWWKGYEPADAHYVKLGLIDDTGAQVVVTQTPEGSRVDGAVRNLESWLFDATSAPDEPMEQLVRTAIFRGELIAEYSLDLPERARYSDVQTALGSDILTTFSDRSKSVDKAIKKRISDAQDAYEVRRREIGVLQSELAGARDAVGGLEAVSDAEEFLRTVLDLPDRPAQELITAAEREKVRLQRNIDAVSQVRSDWAGLLESRPRVQELERQSHAVQQELEKTERTRAEAQRLIEALSERLSSVGRVRGLAEHLAALHEHGRAVGLQDGACPLCQKEQSEAEFQQALNNLSQHVQQEALRAESIRGELAEAQERLAALDAELERTRLHAAEVRRAINEHQRRETEIRERASRLEISLPDADEPVPSIAAWITEQRRRRQELEDAADVLRASEAYHRVLALEERITEAEARSERAEEELRTLEHALQSFTGLRRGVVRAIGEVVQDRLAAMEPLLKDLYRRLEPNEQWDEIGYYLRGSVRRFLSLEVGEGLNPRFMFSSGQRRALGLGFLIAVYLSRPWSRLTTLIVDDPVQHVDDFRAIHITEVFAAVRRLGRQVICTVENPALARLMARRLKPTLEDPGSTVTLGYEIDDGVRLKDTGQLMPFSDRVLLTA